jgi:hypothetical protein
MRFIGVAAVAVAAAAVLLIPPSAPVQFRSIDAPLPTLSLFPADRAVVTDLRPQFRWTPFATSSVYRFTLLDANGVTVWSHDLRDTIVLLPSTLVLSPGTTYLWRVETFLADRSLERSTLHAFTYTPSK